MGSIPGVHFDDLASIQRSADILKMTRTDIAGDEVHVVQEKTGIEIWVPLHPDLQAELAVTERRGETITPTAHKKASNLTPKQLL